MGLDGPLAREQEEECLVTWWLAGLMAVSST